MEYLGYIGIASLVITLLIIVFLFYKRSKFRIEYQNLKRNIGELSVTYEETRNQVNELSQQADEINKEIERAIQNRKLQQERAEDAQAATNLLIASEQNRLTETLTHYKETELEKIRQEKDQLIQILQEQYKEKQIELDNNFILKQATINNELAEQTKNLEEFKAISEAVNQAILREKELKDQENFYSLQISKNDQEDIQILQSMDLKLHNRNVLPKLIWELFVRRPTQEMIKRVTSGRDISGIYKITYKNTGESYIGKTTSISTRWQNHIKTAVGLDAAACSTLHTRMAADGIWNYTFEIIEEVPKSQLSAREAFYIDLYGTKQQLNMKAGEKKNESK